MLALYFLGQRSGVLATLPVVACAGFGAAQFFMRSLIVEDDAELIVSLDGQEIMRKKLRFVKPPEMLSVEVPGELTARGGQLSFALNGGGR